MFGVPAEAYQVDPEVAKALDLLFILHADHEQNCSTSTVRLVGSSRGEPVRLASRPASTRCGARCTAAPTRPCSRCSRRSASDGGDVSAFVNRVKNKEAGVKLMGFGHRVYKNYDPRAAHHQGGRRRAAAPSSARNDQLLDIAMQLEEVALTDDYFIEPQALPERRLLHRPHLPRDGLPDRDVHRAVRDRPAARLDRALAARCSTTRRPRSAARARSTPARPSATSSPWRSARRSRASRPDPDEEPRDRSDKRF